MNLVLCAMCRSIASGLCPMCRKPICDVTCRDVCMKDDRLMLPVQQVHRIYVRRVA